MGPTTDLIVRSGECEDILSWMDEPEKDSHQRMLGMVHPEDRAGFVATLESLNPEKATCQISYRVVRPDESVVWLEESARAFFDTQGTMMRMVGMVSDVSARKRAEKELSDLSARFVTAQEEERTRIARELHDDLSQRLALVAVTLESLGQDLPKGRSQITAALHNLWYRVGEISSVASTPSFNAWPRFGSCAAEPMRWNRAPAWHSSDCELPGRSRRDPK